MADDVRVQAHFSGHVQGVGFRFTALDVADNFRGITGFVRNLPDGRVEVVAEGAEELVGAFLDALEAAMEAHIHNVIRNRLPARGEFSNFTVAR